MPKLGRKTDYHELDKANTLWLPLEPATAYSGGTAPDHDHSGVGQGGATISATTFDGIATVSAVWTHSANLVLDDGAGDSPILRFIGEQDDEIDIFLDDTGVAGTSHLNIDLADASGNSDFRIRDSSNFNAFRIDSDGNMWLRASVTINGTPISATGVWSFDGTSTRAYFGDGLGSAAIAIDGAAANNRTLWFMTNASTRWAVKTNNTAEGGSNAGSDFVIERRSDAGAALGDALTITRSSGDVTFESNIIMPEDGYIGIDAAGERLIFDGTAGQLQVAGADLYLPTGLGIVHADGVAIGDVLRANGTRYVPATLDYSDLAGNLTDHVHSAVAGQGGATISATTFNGTPVTASGVWSFDGTGTRAYFGDGLGSAAIAIDGAAANNRTLWFMTNASTRWAVKTNNTAEGGSNAGSDFVIERRSDAGAALGDALTITRSSGDATFESNIIMPEDGWIGRGSAAGRIIFNTTPTPDVITIDDAELQLVLPDYTIEFVNFFEAYYAGSQTRVLEVQASGTSYYIPAWTQWGA